MLRILLFAAALAAVALARAPHPAPLHDPVASAQALLARVLGSAYLPDVAFSVIPPDAASGNDVFTLAAGAAPAAVAIAGSSGVALSAGLGWYLKYSLNASWGWGFNNSGHNMALPPPGSLPPPATPGRFASPARVRYSWNTCTFGYSFAFYSLQQWREEIDRIALAGINAPLLPIGVEFAEAEVYGGLGMTEAELQNWFTGHSHAPWRRMANIKKIAGPLPAAARAQQRDLGIAVSAMMTALGMTPVLNGFAGHVPDALRRLYPAANISASSDWGAVGCNFSCDGLLEPTDPLFATLGRALNAKVLALYGAGVAAPYFNADTFNEEQPSSGDPDYLIAWNSAVYGAMTAVAPNSVYVMQAWAFHGGFWTSDRVRAYLSPVPLQRMLILDLNTEDGPVWQNYDAFFGHDWSWCGLIVFGGRRGIYGNLPVLGSSIYAARAAAPNLVGVGITPEAIDQCDACVLLAAALPPPLRPCLGPLTPSSPCPIVPAQRIRHYPRGLLAPRADQHDAVAAGVGGAALQRRRRQRLCCAGLCHPRDRRLSRGRPRPVSLRKDAQALGRHVAGHQRERHPRRGAPAAGRGRAWRGAIRRLHSGI